MLRLALLLLVLLAAPSSAAASVALGTSHGSTVRLSGRTVTVRLAPAVLRGRPRTLRGTLSCGDGVVDDYYDGPIWISRTRRRFLLQRGRRRYVVRLPRDVSGRASVCSIVHGPYDAPDLVVELAPAAGAPPPPCRAVGRERVVARSGEALLLNLPGPELDPYASPWRACLRPRGRSRLLDLGYGGSSQGQYEPGRFVLAGHWVAWTAEGFDRDTPSSAGVLFRRDLRAAARPTVTPEPAFVGTVATVSAIGLAPDGTAAWVVDARAPETGRPTLSTVLAARTGAGPTELDRAAAPVLGAPAVTPDGRTATWTHDGAPRTAPVPAA